MEIKVGRREVWRRTGGGNLKKDKGNILDECAYYLDVVMIS